MRARTLSILVLLAAALLAAIWLGRSARSGLSLPALAPQVSQPNSYAQLRATRSKHYNPQGKLAYSYKAASMEYFRADITQASERDYSLVQAPELTFLAKACRGLFMQKRAK